VADSLLLKGGGDLPKVNTMDARFADSRQDLLVADSLVH